MKADQAAEILAALARIEAALSRIDAALSKKDRAAGIIRHRLPETGRKPGRPAKEPEPAVDADQALAAWANCEGFEKEA